MSNTKSLLKMIKKQLYKLSLLLCERKDFSFVCFNAILLVGYMLQLVLDVDYFSIVGIAIVFLLIFIRESRFHFKSVNMSKEVCRSCGVSNWTEIDNMNWNSSKEFYCSHLNKIVSIDKIPDNCNYKLEHLVLLQKEKSK